MFLINPYAFGSASNLKFIDVLTSLGLTTNLKLCLDAGDAASYSGSGQVWADTSGGGYDFNRGTGSGSDSADPTFNGVAGNQSSSEYFGYDGGDYFTLGQTNPSWANSFHKAGAKLTIAGVFYWSSMDNINKNSLIGDDGASGVGFSFGSSGSLLRHVSVGIAVGVTFVYTKISSGACNDNSWNFYALSMDMDTGVVIFSINGANEAYTSQSFSGTPSSSAAAYALRIGDLGDGSNIENTGNRVGEVAMWDRALSQTELTALFNTIRGRFGI